MYVVIRQSGPEGAATETRAMAVADSETSAIDFARTQMVALVGSAQVATGVEGGIAVVPDDTVEQTIRFLVQEVAH